MAREALKQSSMVVAAGAVAGIFAALVWWKFGGATQQQPERSAGDFAEAAEGFAVPLPEFTLTERSGKPLSLDDLRGKVWVADFIFTRCPGPCPAMSLKFAQLQRAFRKLADVRLVSISVDPEHDTPEVLTAYADSYEADPERWLFLTGEKQTIINLAVNAFKISAGDDPQLHGTHFVLVDRQGRIRGFYRGSEQTALEQLKRDVRRLAQEPSP
jgi:protein SCO1/2